MQKVCLPVVKMASRQALALLSHARTASLRRVHFDNQPGNVSSVNRTGCFDRSGLYLERIAHSCVFSRSVSSVILCFFLQNMPFQTKNKIRLFFVMMGLASLGFSLPFIAIRFQLSKKSTA